MDTREKNFVSAIVYARNCENEITAFLTMLITELETRFQNTEIILVDDSSTDQTVSKIREVSQTASSCNITILRMSNFHGLELSMNAGNDLAIGDMIYEFDSVLTDYPLEMIFQAYQKLLEGYDMVSVSPVKSRHLTSRFFYKTVSNLTGIRMDTERFRIISRRLINCVNANNTLITYRKMVYQTTGFHSARLTYTASRGVRQKCDSVEKKARRSLAVDSLILFTQFGYRISMAMTLFMMLTSLLMILYSVIIYIAAEPIEGWTTTILFLSVAFFGLFAILTVIIRYLQILVNLMFRRKYYNFSSIEKLTK